MSSFATSGIARAGAKVFLLSQFTENQLPGVCMGRPGREENQTARLEVQQTI
jgi:hypothetical protein